MVIPVAIAVGVEVGHRHRPENPTTKNVGATSSFEDVVVRSLVHEVQQPVHRQSEPEPEDEQVPAKPEHDGQVDRREDERDMRNDDQQRPVVAALVAVYRLSSTRAFMADPPEKTPGSSESRASR